MNAPSGHEITRLLERLREGETDASDELLAVVYGELHRLASRALSRVPPGHTFQTTDLLHEAWMKLFASSEQGWNDRAHFLNVAARAMRQVLVDHAKASKALKRGGDRERLVLDEVLAVFESRGPELERFDVALSALREQDPQLERIVELHFFAGLAFAEIARLLELSERTTYRRWCLARAWLRDALEPSSDP